MGKRRRNKRKRLSKRLRRGDVVSRNVESEYSDGEVDNASARDPDKADHSNKEIAEGTGIWADIESDTNLNEMSRSDKSETYTSNYVNCISVEEFEKIRKTVKNYRSDTVINDPNGLFIIQMWGSNQYGQHRQNQILYILIMSVYC